MVKTIFIECTNIKHFSSTFRTTAYFQPHYFPFKPFLILLLLLCTVLGTDFTRQENNLQLLIGTTIVTDQLLWDVKEEKQDIAVNTTSAQKNGTRA